MSTEDEWPDDGALFDSEDLSALRATPDISPKAANRARNYARLREEERYKKAKQRNRLRSVFFYWAATLATLVIAGSWAVIWFYANEARAKMDTAVVITWISGAVVQMLGIIYIVAQYLFPKKPVPNGKES